jgi:hypothetical protein
MSDFEQWLRRYRPVGPPPELQRFELHEYPIRPRIVEWLPALAAAGLIALFSALSHRVHIDIDARLSVSDDVRQVEQWLPEYAGERP